MKIKKRHQYSSSEDLFPRNTSKLDPFALFEKCFHLANERNPEANQMVLSTVSLKGSPASRMVLLKEFNEKGFVFYTHYNSRKGLEMEKNPFVALNFYWDEIKIQIRVEGEVRRVSPERSSEYFESRPRDSQLGAIISKQSRPLESYEKFLNEFNESRKLGIKLTRPEFWGGYQVEPNYFEFWRGNRNRLHERISFSKQKTWAVQHLYP